LVAALILRMRGNATHHPIRVIHPVRSVHTNRVMKPHSRRLFDWAEIPPEGAKRCLCADDHWRAIARPGGIPLVDEWIDATDLIAVGVASAEEVPA
jgi:hypothetical protein